MSATGYIWSKDNPPVGAGRWRGGPALGPAGAPTKAEHNCVSCHHAGLVAWSMREARLRGFAVEAGDKGAENVVPITGAGTAWAVLGW